MSLPKKYSYYEVNNEENLLVLHHIRQIPLSAVSSLDLALETVDRPLIEDYLRYKRSLWFKHRADGIDGE